MTPAHLAPFPVRVDVTPLHAMCALTALQQAGNDVPGEAGK
ncbi:hypothetical protein [Gluconacetobacter entanii]|nr:hypothetical protein [Gluconacetobacter entanii]MCW4580167.1 hypothetical protein [Gluconacetobacter entanii]MCW4584683.1 hypothetical protein [Gluconacetobacter entanii]MCW4588055.1 hypothetical protein [Gluconacetobacter entanii]